MTETPAPGPRLGGRPLRAVLRDRLSKDLNDPLYRAAYTLLVNVGAGAVLGFGFWVVAARMFDQAAVGQSLALITAMRMLSGMTSFGFVGSLTRFIPEMGRSTNRFVFGIYGVGGGMALLATAGFLLTLDLWGDNYGILAGPLPAIVFSVMVIIWVLWTLQDVVLAALRKSEWVPVENIILSVVKIILMVLAATLFASTLSTGDEHSWAIYLSWIAPGLVSVPLINFLIARRLVPQHVIETKDRTRPSRAGVLRFLAGDYFGAFVRLSMGNLVPFIVAVHVTKSTNASYGMAVTIATMLESLAYTMATSLTIEGAYDASTLALNARRAMRRTVMTLVPLVTATVLIAPFALALLGPGYQEATTVLRLIAIAAIPRAFIELYLGVLRAKGRAKSLAAIQTVQFVITMVGVLTLLPVMGINGVGFTLLGCQLTVAAAITPGLVRVFIDPAKAMSVTRAPWWRRWARVLPPILVTEGLLLHLLGPQSARLATSMAGLGLIVVSYFFTIADGRRGAIMGLLHLGGAAVCLYPPGRAGAAIAALVDQVARTGVVPPGTGTGLLPVVAFLLRSGSVTAGQVLSWLPLACAVLSVPPLMTLLRTAPSRPSVTLLFVAAAWSLQAFYPPLGPAFLLYLCFVAILADRRFEAPTVALLVALASAAAFVHPLTALMMAGSCLGLLIARRGPWRLLLPAATGAAAGSWALLRDGMAVTPSSWALPADHMSGLLPVARIGLPLILAVMAVWGLVRLIPALRRGDGDVAAPALLISPVIVTALTFPLVGAASLGIALIYLLPAACLLASWAALAHPDGK